MSEKALEIKKLIKDYGKGFRALNGIDIEIEQGDFFALLGPNGAGKSTTIGIISSLVNKTSGSVKVFGYDLDTQPDRVKSCIGLVPQEFNFGIFENVEDIVFNQARYYGTPYNEAKEKTEYYLKKLSLWDKRKSMARTLSGGMKRRLMIARGMVHSPKLLILDEPTAGVDIEIRRDMWSFLKEINLKGVTIILTTHYLEEAEQLCRNIAVINKGDIIELTSVRELLAKLSYEKIVLDLDAVYNEIPELEGFNLSLQGDSLEVTYCKESDLNTLFKHLNENNIKVHSMRNKTNRLEEMFLQLTNN